MNLESESGMVRKIVSIGVSVLLLISGGCVSAARVRVTASRNIPVPATGQTFRIVGTLPDTADDGRTLCGYVEAGLQSCGLRPVGAGEVATYDVSVAASHLDEHGRGQPVVRYRSMPTPTTTGGVITTRNAAGETVSRPTTVSLGEPARHVGVYETAPTPVYRTVVVRLTVSRPSVGEAAEKPSSLEVTARLATSSKPESVWPVLVSAAVRALQTDGLRRGEIVIKPTDRTLRAVKTAK